MTIPISQIIFYAFAALAVFSAFMVITQNNPVRCVLFLVLTFFCACIIWLMAQAEFLALILVLVYVGAVMTLFLFVVMMLDIELVSMRKHFMRYLPFALLVFGVFMSLVFHVLKPAHSVLDHLPQAAKMISAEASNTHALGLVLYTQYAYPVILAAVLLVVAIIAAISLAHRAPRDCKTQDVAAQIRVRREDRVTLVKMQAERE